MKRSPLTVAAVAIIIVAIVVIIAGLLTLYCLWQRRRRSGTVAVGADTPIEEVSIPVGKPLNVPVGKPAFVAEKASPEGHVRLC